ncbi:MAG TPA: OsmC family protein [Thermoanaerobaculia bacterium]|nr:OsmC family protein [Thermoanaerobaculia bacterium]
MAVHIGGRYLGELKTELTHEPSGAVLRTAAPLDNQGDGSSFSPTDLVAAGLGACMMTILGIVARRDGIDLTGATFSVDKHMTAEPPRRIARLVVVLRLPASVPVADRDKLRRAALTCPVHRSLLPEIDIPLEVVYE